MKMRLTKPILVRWANHHKKDFELGDPEVTITLPVGTEVKLEAQYTINSGKIFDYATLELCDFTYTNPLSGATSRGTITADCLE